MISMQCNKIYSKGSLLSMLLSFFSPRQLYCLSLPDFDFHKCLILFFDAIHVFYFLFHNIIKWYTYVIIKSKEEMKSNQSYSVLFFLVLVRNEFLATNTRIFYRLIHHWERNPSIPVKNCKNWYNTLVSLFLMLNNFAILLLCLIQPLLLMHLKPKKTHILLLSAIYKICN